MTPEDYYALGQMTAFIGLGFAVACIGLSVVINAVRGRWFSKP